jgi:hypothetical protein
LQYVVAAPDRVGYTSTLKSVHLNVPNDLFNGNRRQIYTTQGEHVLASPPRQAEILELGSPWVNVDGKLGLIALYGGQSLCVDRSTRRRGGRYRSLFVDEICLQVETATRRRMPGETLIDAGFAVLSSADAGETAAFQGGALNLGQAAVRGVWAIGADGQRYVLLANWSERPTTVDVWDQTVTLAPDQAVCQAL